MPMLPVHKSVVEGWLANSYRQLESKHIQVGDTCNYRLIADVDSKKVRQIIEVVVVGKQLLGNTTYTVAYRVHQTDFYMVMQDIPKKDLILIRTPEQEEPVVPDNVVPLSIPPKKV